MATAADLYKQLGITGTLNLSPEESEALTNASAKTVYKYNEKEAEAYKNLYAQPSLVNNVKDWFGFDTSRDVSAQELQDFDTKLFNEQSNIAPNVSDLGDSLTNKLFGEGSYDRFTKLAQYDMPVQGGDFGDPTKATLPFNNTTMSVDDLYKSLEENRERRQSVVDTLRQIADGSYDLSKISDEARAGNNDDTIRYRAQRTLAQITADKKDKSTKAGDKFFDFVESYNQSLFGPVSNNLAIQAQKVFKNDTKEQDQQFAKDIERIKRIDLKNSEYGGKYA